VIQYRLTRHAKNRKRWRRISDEEILVTLEMPDKIEKENGTETAYKTVGDRLIKVSFVMDDDVFLILTVMAKSKRTDDK
jgi:hypothetical protein